MNQFKIVCLSASLLALACLSNSMFAQSGADSTLHFARDIQPILSNHCFACHGPDSDSREAGLRLDDSNLWQEELESGDGIAIVPGDSEHSVLLQRVLSEDGDQMPPDDFGKPLTSAQKELLKRWIDEGAHWEPHWAYAPLKKVTTELPKGSMDQPWVRQWNRQPIDQILASEILKNGISSNAGTSTLHPNPKADAATLMRRLHFDLTGLPPTFEVVQQFAANPSDQNYAAIVDRLLASPQHAEHMTRYWLDWVRFADTVGYHGDQGHAVWPYRDYVIKSFLENKPFDQFTIEQLAGDLLEDPTEDQLIASAYNRLLQTTHEGGAQDLEYREKYLSDRVRNFSEVWLASTLACAQCHDHKYDPLTQKDFYSLGAFFADIEEMGSYDGKAPNDTPTLRHPQKVVVSPLDRAKLPNDFEQQLEVLVSERLEAELATTLAEKIKKLEAKKAETEAKGNDNANDRDGTAEESKQVLLSNREKNEVRSRLQAKIRNELYDKYKIRSDWCMYTRSVQPREIRLLPRGDWLDRSGPVVEPATPAALPPLQQSISINEKRLNRLHLAKWLFQEDNPLPARVLANRIWFIAFHQGISSNLGDFGFQGHWPTDPQLLDYLSQRLIDSGWDIRAVLREIVLSEAYQQDSRETITGFAANRLYLRQNRPRLSAEEIRDNALSVSGLLVPEVGGPSAMPYQPAGYYRSLNFPVREYQPSTGDQLYRRGVYVHWQRQFLHPMLKAFDAPTREECTAQRSISNTPSSALVLLNAPEFVEAARSLVLVAAADVGKDGNDVSDPRAVIERMFQRVLSREADEKERNDLVQLFDRQRSAAQPDDIEQILSVATPLASEKITQAGLQVETFYALTQVARVLLNLDEAVTRY